MDMARIVNSFSKNSGHRPIVLYPMFHPVILTVAKVDKVNQACRWIFSDVSWFQNISPWVIDSASITEHW